jgi:hypothetical protein
VGHGEGEANDGDENEAEEHEIGSSTAAPARETT